MLLAEMPLPSGAEGTYQTVRTIRRLIRDGRSDPLIRRTAVRELRRAGVDERDQFGEAETIFDFVRRRLRYTSDPVNVEQVTTARGLLGDYDDGDCDDFVVLLGSLLESIGRPVRVKVVRPGATGPWKHVYLEVRIDGEWYPADATHPTQRLGWEVEHGDSFVAPVDGQWTPPTTDGLGFVGPLLSVASGAAGPLATAWLSNKQAKDAEKAAEKAAKKKKKVLTELLEAQIDGDITAQDVMLAFGGGPDWGPIAPPPPTMPLPEGRPTPAEHAAMQIAQRQQQNELFLPKPAPPADPDEIDWQKLRPMLLIAAGALAAAVLTS